jgi:hypothetical protein
MSAFSYRSSRPNEWILPRSHFDANQRRMIYGPIQPMEEDAGFWKRLFSRH